MNLYKHTKQYIDFLNTLEEEYDENDEQKTQFFENKIKQFVIEGREGCIEFAKTIKEMDAHIGLLETEMARLKKKSDTLKRRSRYMKDMLRPYVMRYTNGEGVIVDQQAPIKCYLGRGRTVVDEEILPQEFWRPRDPVPDLEKVKEHLKRGEQVQGAKIIVDELIKIG